MRETTAEIDEMGPVDHPAIQFSRGSASHGRRSGNGR
jgi:hypothetical protein